MKKKTIFSLLTAAILSISPLPTQAAETGYTLREVDLSGILGEDCRLWAVERTEIGTYLLRAGFPHTYTKTDENGETYTEENYALYYAVADENFDILIPWFMHDTGGRGGSYMTYADDVYSFINEEPRCYFDPTAEGTVCEFYGEDGKPLFAHEDYVCAGQMIDGYAWVGVAGDLNMEWNEREVKEYQVIDKTGTVRYTIDPMDYLVGDYGISWINNMGDGTFKVSCYDTVTGDADRATLYLSYDKTGKARAIAAVDDSETKYPIYLEYTKNGYTIVSQDGDDGFKYGIMDKSGEIVVPLAYKCIYDFNEYGYWARKPQAYAAAMYDWDGNPLTEAIYFHYRGDSPEFSEDGYIHWRRAPVNGVSYLDVLLDAQGHEVALPVKTYYNEDGTYTELMGYRDGWLRFESYAGEKDENGKPVYTNFLANWKGETLTFPTTKEITSLGNGMYRSGSSANDFTFYVLTPSEGSTAVTGDLTGDGTIDIMDVIKINKFLLGSATLTATEKSAADVDQSGEVDSTDALNILKYVVELIDTLPLKR